MTPEQVKSNLATNYLKTKTRIKNNINSKLATATCFPIEVYIIDEPQNIVEELIKEYELLGWCVGYFCVLCAWKLSFFEKSK